jgi:glycosyltransferase involved in cell wall biosynthesis
MIASNQNISKSKEKKAIDGIKVIYLKVPYDNKMSIFKRLISFIKFMFRSTREVLKQKDVDLVIATSTPLTIGFPALVVNWFKKTPYLFEVRDLWPEVPIQMGVLKNPVLKKLAITFEKRIYKKAKHIVALSPGMRDGVIAAGTPAEKVSMIPNMAKIDIFWPRDIDTSIYEKYNLNLESLKVIHFGAMGLANGLEYIIHAAKELKRKNVNDIDFIFLGDGAVKSKLEAEVKAKELYNVYFLGEFSMHETSKIVNTCHVSLVTFAKFPILATNSPNKLFDSLSAGKPIIVNSNGWTKSIVEQYECGFYVDATKPERLAQLLVQLKYKKSLLQKMSNNSRRLAETKYDKSILCREFVDIVESRFV